MKPSITPGHNRSHWHVRQTPSFFCDVWTQNSCWCKKPLCSSRSQKMETKERCQSTFPMHFYLKIYLWWIEDFDTSLVCCQNIRWGRESLTSAFSSYGAQKYIVMAAKVAFVGAQTMVKKSFPPHLKHIIVWKLTVMVLFPSQKQIAYIGHSETFLIKITLAKLATQTQSFSLFWRKWASDMRAWCSYQLCAWMMIPAAKSPICDYDPNQKIPNPFTPKN